MRGFFFLRAGRFYNSQAMSEGVASIPGKGKVVPARDPLLALHAAIDAEGVWQAGVAVLKASMPAYHYLMALPTEGMKPFLLRTTLPVPDEADYWDRLNRAAPLEGLLKRLAGQRVARMSDMVPFVVMRFSPFYRKFMKPEGWRYSAAMFFWDGDQYLGQFAQNRTAGQGDFTDQEMEVLAALHEHFEIAIRRVMLFDRERSGRLAVEESIRRSPLPTAVLEWDLTLVYHNPAAAEACAEWRFGPDRSRALKPVFELPDDLREATVALRQAAAAWHNGSARLPGEKILSHPRGDGSEAIVRLIGAGSSGMAKPRLLVEFRNAGTPGKSADRAVSLARLTGAEREVALLVARGMENEEIATTLGISRSTVRTHLRSIFAKLKVTKRTQLAILLRG